MARELIDLLWRDHPLAPKGGTRGPRAKVTTSQAVDVAISVANTDGLDAVTVRRLAADLGISGMAVYTHVGSRDDLLVLMVDAVHGRSPLLPYGNMTWRQRVRRVAEEELASIRSIGGSWTSPISAPRWVRELSRSTTTNFTPSTARD